MTAHRVTYDLADWPAESRDALAWLFSQNGIEAVWQGSWFSVPAMQQPAADRLIAWLNGTDGDRAGAVPAGNGGAALYQAQLAPTPPGWYPDPLQPGASRWWDGRRWTDYVGAPPASLDRGWFPPPGDREQSARGGWLALAGFVGGQLASIAVVLLAIVLGATSRSVPTLVVGEFALWAGLFGSCKLAVDRYGTGSLRDLGLVRLRPGDVGIGALASLVARVGTLIIAAILVIIFGIDNLGNDTSVTRSSGVSTLGVVAVALIVVVGAPFFEELFFRGLVQGVLTRRYGGRAAICLQAIAFGLVHYQIGMSAGQAFLTFAMIMPTGFLLGVLRWRYERLGPGMLTHAFFNAMAVAVLIATR